MKPIIFGGQSLSTSNDIILNSPKNSDVLHRKYRRFSSTLKGKSNKNVESQLLLQKTSQTL